LESFHWFRGEGFGLIVADLLELPSSVPVVVEGFRLLPQLVRPLLSDLDHAVWLLPTPAFRRGVIGTRAGDEFVLRTSDPQRAAQNIAERDKMFASRIRADTDRLGLRVLDVDTTTSED